MRKIWTMVVAVTIVSVLLFSAMPVLAGGKQGTTLQEGGIKYSAGHYLAGQPINVGYDVFGYNYQAHMFSGSYANVYLGAAGFPPYEGDDAAYLAANPEVAKHWAWPYRKVNLIMKWNDAWISNMDRDGDGKLDRHYGYTSYRGSGAWETNHMSDSYEDGGKTYTWNDFVKIVAAPLDAVKIAGVWYTAGGAEMGPDIWGEFATIQEVYNDTGTGDHGILYRSLAGPGFGQY